MWYSCVRMITNKKYDAQIFFFFFGTQAVKDSNLIGFLFYLIVGYGTCYVNRSLQLYLAREH